MKSRIIIHNGTNTIGGNCIEIQQKNTRIILDLGIPLTNEKGESLSREEIKNQNPPNIPGLYQRQTPEVKAVILSHAHLDPDISH